MTSAEVYASLAAFGRPVVTTEDAAVRLRVSVATASKTLKRLADTGLVFPIRRGLWSMRSAIDPLVLPEYLTAPFPSYVSMLTALSHHGMIDQLPRVVTVASLASTRTIATRFGTFSVHQIAPEFFGGFTEVRDSGIKLATPEKALLDVFYLSRGRSRMYVRLPELELGARFRVREARRWIARIPGTAQRTMVQSRFESVLTASGERG